MAKFAETALKNYLDSKKTVEVLSKERAYENILDNFKEVVQNEIEAEGKYHILGTTANIIEVTEKSFQYNFPFRENIIYNMLFSDIITIGTADISITKSKALPKPAITLAWLRKIQTRDPKRSATFFRYK